MYGWLWRHLPGSTAVRVAILVVLAAAVLAACFTWLFPAIAPFMPFNNTTVGAR
jgi:Flp pilus assembly pilin Flp